MKRVLRVLCGMSDQLTEAGGSNKKCFSGLNRMRTIFIQGCLLTSLLIAMGSSVFAGETLGFFPTAQTVISQNTTALNIIPLSGITRSAIPPTDENGYHLIQNEGDFSWYAEQLKTQNTLKAKIAGDFELLTLDHLPIANFTGELGGVAKPDGGKYKITVRNNNYKQVFTEITATGKIGGFIFEIPEGLGGTFDGNGLFITNMYGVVDGMDFIYGTSRTYLADCTTGMIRNLYGTIRNTTAHLTENASLKCGAECTVGLLVGDVNAAGVVIENCAVYLDGALGNSNIGGLVGYWGGANGQMRNCLVKAGPACNITVNDGTSGGLVGKNSLSCAYQNCWYLYDTNSTSIPKQTTGAGNLTGTFRVAYNGAKTVLPLGPFTTCEPNTGIPSTVLLSGSTADYSNFPGKPGYTRLKDRTINHTFTSDLELSIAPEVAPVRFPYAITSSSIPVDINGAAAINTIEEWNMVSDVVENAQPMNGVIFRLNKSLTGDASLKSIGRTAANPFCGTFECNIDPMTEKPYKITISGAMSNTGGPGGLFGHVGAGGLLRHFNLELAAGGSVAGDGNYAGVLAGRVAGGAISDVNVLVSGTVSATGGSGATDGAVGGLVGQVAGSSITGCAVTLKNATLSLNVRNNNYTCIGGFAGAIRAGSTVTYSMVDPASVTFSGSGNVTENGLFVGRVNDGGSSMNNTCYIAAERMKTYPFNTAGSASDGVNGAVRFYYGDITMFISIPSTLIPGEGWIVTPNPLELNGFTASGATLTPPPVEGKYSGNVTFTCGDKLNFVLPYRMIVYAKSVFDAKTRYVTVSGATSDQNAGLRSMSVPANGTANTTGYQDGCSWETAYAKEMIPSLLTDPNVTKICLGGGTYPLSETLVVPAGKTLEGGYTVTGGTAARTLAETGRLGDGTIYPWEFKTPTIFEQSGNYARLGINMNAAGTVVDGITATKGSHGILIGQGSKLINSIVEDNQGATTTSYDAQKAVGVTFAGTTQSFIEKCLIFNNRQTSNGGYADHCAAGVATSVDGGGNAHLRDCFIMKNKANDGTGGLTTGKSASLTMINCVVTNNETAGNSGISSGGIGRHTSNGNANTIINCTIAYNKTASPSAYGGITLGNGGNMKNNIIWGNVGGAGQSQQTGSYNAIQENTGAMINLNADNADAAGPGFMTVAGTAGYDGFDASSNWCVADIGIPVNRGNNDAVNNITTDISGTTARIMKTFTDLGAYESSNGIGPVSNTITVTVTDGAVTNAKDHYTTGETIQVSGTSPSSEKVFSHWTVNSGIAISIGSITNETTEFIIYGTENVTLTAHYRINIIRYVTSEGASSKDGLSWETAADSSQISAMLTAANEVRFKTGTYAISSKMTFTTPKKMVGGYTGNGTERIVAADPKQPWEFAEKTIFRSTAPMFIMGGGDMGTPTHVEGITFTGAASTANTEGAVFTFDNTVVMRDCVVRETSGAANNEGSAIEFKSGSNAVVERSLFTRILGRDGMAIGIRGGKVIVDRCAFTNNRQFTGAWGVIRVYGGALDLSNSLFYQNAMVQGSCVYRAGGTVNIYHCTFAANGESAIYGGMTSVQNSLFYGNKSNGSTQNTTYSAFNSTPPAGVGNIQISAADVVNPQAHIALTDNTLPDITAADWQLQAESMAINRSNQVLLSNRPFDLNGLPRTWLPPSASQPGFSDIGAYEYQGQGRPVFSIGAGTSYTGSGIDLTSFVTSSPAGIPCTVTGSGVTNNQAIDAGTYVVTMSSSSEQWNGSSQGTFTVYPIQIPNEQVRVTVLNTNPLTLSVEVQNGGTWTSTDAYTTVYYREDMSLMPAAPSATDYGKYFVTATLSGNYTGIATAAFTIANPLADWTVSYEISEDVIYNAAVQDPLIVKAAKDGESEKTLVKGTDYTVLYTHSVNGSHEAKNAGDYYVRVTIPAVSDKVLEQTMTIKPAEIGDDEYIVESQHQFSDGTPKNLTVRLKNAKESYPCVIGTDFKIEYAQTGTVAPSTVGVYDAVIIFYGNYLPKNVSGTLNIHDATIRYVGNGATQGDGLGYDLANAMAFSELQTLLNTSTIKTIRLGTYDYTVTSGYTIPASKTLSGGWNPETGALSTKKTRFIAQSRNFTMFTATAGTAGARTTIKDISAESGQKAFQLNGYGWVENCRIFDMQNESQGGSAFNSSGTDNRVVGCIIEKNLDNNNERGYIDNGENITLVNCVIAHNQNNNSGAAFGGTYINCTFVGNTKAVCAYGVSGAGNTVLRNCLFWNNGEDVKNDKSLTILTSAFVKGGYADAIVIDNTSNTTATAPKFAHVENMTKGNAGYHASNDWSLLPTSYMINRGTDTAITGYTVDITGKERIQTGYIDLGAYESAQKGTVICTVAAIPNTVYSASAYPATSPAATVTGNGNHNMTLADPLIEYKNAEGSPEYVSTTAPVDAGNYIAGPRVTEPQYWDISGSSSYTIQKSAQTVTITPDKQMYEVGETATFTMTESGLYPELPMYMAVDGGELEAAPFTYTFIDENDHSFRFTREGGRNFDPFEKNYLFSADDPGNTYTITCLPADKVQANKVSSAAGKTITVTASQTDADFYRWTSEPAVTFADPYATETTFVMPESAVTVTAEYTVPGTIRYVTKDGAGTKRGYSWRNAAPFSQLPTILATEGIEVWIGGGTYVGSITAVGANVVRGGFAGTETAPEQRIKGTEPWSFTHPTVIQGNSTNRVFAFKTGMILDGVTLDGNKANYTIGGRGAAFEIWGSGTALNCIIQNAKTSNGNGGGGGIGIGSSGDVLIDGCLIQDNESPIIGGGICVGTDPNDSSGKKIIRNCLIQNNTTPGDTGGGGIFARGTCNVEVERTRIFSNQASGSRGGGVFLTGDVVMTMKYCSIMHNQARFNGAGIRLEISSNSTLNMYHSLVANNYLVTDPWGAGGISTHGTLNIYNSTIVNNKCGAQGTELGGGIKVYAGTTKLYNTVVWGNVYGDGNVKNQIEGPATLVHCAVEGRTAETTNLNLNADNNAVDGPNFSLPSANPEDTNWASAKWNLKPASILINESDMTEVRDDFDLAGASCVWNPDGQTGGVADIGAYETQQAANRAVTWSNMSVSYSGSAVKTAVAADADARLPKSKFGYSYSSEPVEPAEYTVTARDLSGHWTITNTGTYTVTKALQNLRVDPSATMIASGNGVTFTIQKGESSADVVLASVEPSTYTETDGVYYPQAAGNYVFTFTQTGNDQYESATVAVTVTVTEKTLTTLVAGAQKTTTYDGKAISANPATITNGGTNPAVYEYCMAGSSAWVNTAPKNVGTYDVRISVSGDDAVSGNTLIEKANLVISAAELSVSGMRVAAKAYDGNTTANISYWGDLVGIIKGDDVIYVTASAAAMYASAEIGDAIVVTASGLSISGKSASNYEFNGTATAFGDILPLDNTVILASAYQRPATVEAILLGSGKYPVSWSGSGAESLKNVMVEYSQDLTFSGTLPVNDQSTAIVPELKSNTLYNFRLAYDAPDGSGLYSNTIQGKTDYYASAGQHKYPMMSWSAGTRYVINRISSGFSSGVYIANDVKDPVRDLTDDNGTVWMRSLTDPALPRIRVLGGTENTITVTVNERGENAAQNVKLNVWTDINANGQFDTDEMTVIRKGASTSSADNLLTFTLPAFEKSMHGTEVMMRVRASHDETGRVDAYGLENTDAGMAWDAVLFVTPPSDENAFFVTFNVGENGSVTDLNGTPLVSPVSVQKGSTLNYKITPASGYSVENILINSVQSKIARGDFTLNNIYRNYVVDVTFTDFPTIFINVNDGSEITSKEEYKKATVIMEENITAAGPKETADVEIKGRGNSTWSYAKKPYRLKYPKKNLQNFFGMGEERNWVLLANYIDPSGMRNDVAFKIGRQIGVPFTYETQHVRMIMNGRYDGLYQLTEQCEVSKNRVDIGDNDWLCEFDTYQDELVIPTDKFRMPTKFKQPDPTEGGNTAPVMAQLNAFENAINSVDKLNPAYEAHINEASFIDWLIVHMIAGNYEPKHPKSTYFHTNTKSGNGKITAGVLWDFDWAYGYGGNEGNFATLKNCMWFKNLFQYPAFTAKFKARWNEIRPMLESGENDIYSYIDTKSAAIATEQTRDYVRWKKNENFTNQTTGLKNWLKSNFAYFDQQINAMAVESYAVTTGATTNGSVTVSSSEAAVGSLVTLTVTPDLGYSIAKVSYNDGTEHIITPTEDVYSFRMPAKAVTVNAVFNQIATLFTFNASKTTAVEGENIDFTATFTSASSSARIVTINYPELDWTGSKVITIPAGQTAGTLTLTSLKVGATRVSEVMVTAIEPDDSTDITAAKVSVTLNASSDAPNVCYVSVSGAGYKTGWNPANAATGADAIQKLIETAGVETIRIAGGTYSKATVPSQATAYLINRPISISGNWNEAFTAQNASTTPTTFTSTTTRIFTLPQTLTNAVVNIDNINVINVKYVDHRSLNEHGVGILSYASGTTLNVTNCRFEDITGAGIISSVTGSVGGSVRISDCTFFKCNARYGILNAHHVDNPVLFMDRCDVRACTGLATAVVMSRSDLVMTNTLIANCDGIEPGVDYRALIFRPNGDAKFTIVNCTFVRNRHSKIIDNSNTEQRNNVYWANYYQENIIEKPHNVDCDTAHGNYALPETANIFEAPSDVKGCVEGSSTYTDENVAKIMAADWHTLSTARIINRGLNSAATTATTLDGNARIYGDNGIVDAGAYEYQGKGNLGLMVVQPTVVKYNSVPQTIQYTVEPSFAVLNVLPQTYTDVGIYENLSVGTRDDALWNDQVISTNLTINKADVSEILFSILPGTDFVIGMPSNTVKITAYTVDPEQSVNLGIRYFGGALPPEGQLEFPTTVGAYTARAEILAQSGSYTLPTVHEVTFNVIDLTTGIILTANPQVVNEGGTVELNAIITPAVEVERTLTINYSPLDFSGVTEMIIPAGSTSGTLTLISKAAGFKRNSEIKITAVSNDPTADLSKAKTTVALNPGKDLGIRYVTMSGAGYKTGWNAENAATGADTIQKLIETAGVETIRIAGGTYSKATVPSQATAYLINRPISISGNWDETFTAQNATTTPTTFTSTTTRIFTLPQTLTDAAVDIDNINIRDVTHVPETNTSTHGMGILNNAVRTVLNVTNCYFENITGSGVISSVSSVGGSVRVANCKFFKCKVFYAAISSHATSNASSMVIDRCEIRECSGAHTAAVLSRGEVTLSNTLIAKCKGVTPQEGYIICRPDGSSSFNITNCTFVQNEPSIKLISNNNSSVRNCIIWPNTVIGVPPNALSRCAISEANGTPGEVAAGTDESFYLDSDNNAKFGPKFENPDEGVWTPLRGSVLINRGKAANNP